MSCNVERGGTMWCGVERKRIVQCCMREYITALSGVVCVVVPVNSMVAGNGVTDCKVLI